MARENQLEFTKAVRESGGAAQSFIKELLKKHLLKLIVAKLPFLGGGIFGGIIGIAVSWLLGKILVYVQELIEQGIIFLKIDFDVNGQHKDYVKAHDKLKEATTKGEKKHAQKKLDKAFRDFVNLN